MSIEPDLMAVMDCRELERSVDAYLDGEFDERERAEAEAHVAGCARCRQLVLVQGRLRGALRARLREAMGARAPAQLRARVEASLARRRSPWLRLLSPVPLSAVAACAAGVLVVLTLRGGDSALMEEAIRKHHRGLPLEVTASMVGEASIPGWFKGKLDFRPSLPHFSGPDVHVEGARLSNIREFPAAYVRYQLPQGQAGLFIVDDPQNRFEATGREVKVGPRVVRVANGAGYNVAVWRQNEIVYSLVTNLDEAQLFALVQTAQASAGR